MSDLHLDFDELKKQLDDTAPRYPNGAGEDSNYPTSLDAPSLRFLEAPQTVPPEPPDLDLASLLSHPCIVLVLGHRGNGKTAVAGRVQELKKDVAAPYGVGLPQKASRLLPEWYGLTDDFTAPPSATLTCRRWAWSTTT